MTDPQELAALVRDVLHDRLENSTQENLAFETASLRAFMFSTLDMIDHIRTHVERHDYRTTDEIARELQRLIERLENSIANLEDVRLELQRTTPTPTDTPEP